MNMILDSYDYTDTRTIGRLLIRGDAPGDGEFFCYTLEDRVRPPGAEKIPGETAIPAGRYRVRITWSNRFNRNMPLLENVPNFSGIRMHPLNRASETEGCIGVGFQRTEDELRESRKAYDELLSRIIAGERDDGECWIEVRRNGAPNDV